MVISGACNGGLTVLTGSNGTFSTKGTYYENNARCHWKIEVDKGKVRSCQHFCEVSFVLDMNISHCVRIRMRSFFL